MRCGATPAIDNPSKSVTTLIREDEVHSCPKWPRWGPGIKSIAERSPESRCVETRHVIYTRITDGYEG
jgi:hypothetical protein